MVWGGDAGLINIAGFGVTGLASPNLAATRPLAVHDGRHFASLQTDRALS
jgi:hypothetical protein